MCNVSNSVNMNAQNRSNNAENNQLPKFVSVQLDPEKKVSGFIGAGCSNYLSVVYTDGSKQPIRQAEDAPKIAGGVPVPVHVAVQLDPEKEVYGFIGGGWNNFRAVEYTDGSKQPIRQVSE